MTEYLPEGVEYLLYADYLKIFRSVSSIHDVKMIQEAIDGISKWCVENRMLHSPTKCFVLKSARCSVYTLDSLPLPDKTVARDLGESLERPWCHCFN